jgi:hypothetical protein
MLQSTSQTTSLFLFLLGTIFYFSESRSIKSIYLIFFGLSVFFHFTVGICLILFHLLVTIQTFSLKSFIYVLVVSILVPVVLGLIYFNDGASQIPAKEFIDIYVKLRHPAHYSFADFGGYHGFPWYVSYITVLAILLAGNMVIWMDGKRKLLLPGVLITICYFLAPFIQLFVTEIFPVKLLAALGPVRFSFLGYWMIVVLWSSIFLYKINFETRYVWFDQFRIPEFYFYVLALVVISLGYAFFKDDPFKTIRERDLDFYSWIDSQCDSTDVIAIFDSDYIYQIPLTGKRAVFVGNGFPFSEKHFPEFLKRHTSLFGTVDQLKLIEGDSQHQKSDRYYGQLSLDQIRSIKKEYRLDFIIMRLDQGENLSSLQPVFENKKLKVYNVKNIN